MPSFLRTSNLTQMSVTLKERMNLSKDPYFKLTLRMPWLCRIDRIWLPGSWDLLNLHTLLFKVKKDTIA